MKRRGLKRPRYIVPGDKRTAMERLLQDCQTKPRREGGRNHIEVAYERQFQTLWKAERLGYVIEGQWRLRANRSWRARCNRKAGSMKKDLEERIKELEREVRRVRAYAFDYGNATGECAGGYLQQNGLICHKCSTDDYRKGCPLVKAKP